MRVLKAKKARKEAEGDEAEVVAAQKALGEAEAAAKKTSEGKGRGGE